ncbi:fungal-specific transcription factor domain-containing protein [Exophiala viscosa]|uniref:fungal-specific transcription factor domain-containing protein n=1 Tax=Exophiala viscosa TaxID=2486360 RepID=UPI0021908751|nr:fungal-specific transcription factor domain-containing protein [Exophiala viscosa]
MLLLWNAWIRKERADHSTDQEREFQLVMTGPSVNSTRAGEARSSDLRGIFHGFNQSMTDVQSCHPSRWQALQLWQTFLNNVDPIIKILHVPTVQVTICTAINNPGDAENDLHALLFAIYFAATTSLSTVDAVNLFGQDRGTTLARFKQGLEHSLAGANIFDSPSMRSLQAMTIYITSLRAFHTGRSSWTLAGLALRMAQSIGLHRDGSNLRLSPFESEMRRRVWWYLCAADSRAAEDLGIAVSSVDRSCDTHLPVNVNDSELSPDMQGPPAPKPMWAEMTFSLITIEIGQIIQQITGRPVASAGSIHGESAGAQILKDMRTRLEDRYLRHLNPNIPIQRAISLLTPIILAKLEFVVQQQSTKRRHVKKGAFDANEDTLTVACRLLEMYLQLQTDELLRGFHWYLRSYTQYHLLTYVLWHLCLKPDGPSTERAWNALERSFQLAEPHARVTEPGSKWTVLQLLRGKALRIRETYNATKPDENNDRALEEGFGMAHAASELGDPADIRLSGDWNWGMPDYVDFQDWSNIVEEFDMQGFNGL